MFDKQQNNKTIKNNEMIMKLNKIRFNKNKQQESNIAIGLKYVQRGLRKISKEGRRPPIIKKVGI